MSKICATDLYVVKLAINVISLSDVVMGGLNNSEAHELTGGSGK